MKLIWDGINLPKSGEYAFRLIKDMPFGNWSWFKDSSGRVGISLEIHSAALESNFKSSKYFDVSVLDIKDIGNVLIVVCQDKEFYEVFEVFCKDLVAASINAIDLGEAISLLRSRLVLWADLLRGLKGLTRQEVYGLAAELSFLKIWLLSQENMNLDIWVGPNGKSQDFISISGSNAVEIKASSNDLSSVKISSLEQLDFSGDLILAVFPITSAKDDALEPLNLERLIASIESILPPNQIDSFKRKLAMIGVSLNDEINAIHFEIGEPQYFDVRSGFPRIIKTSISSEIFNCSYDISLISLAEFSTNETNTISRLAK